MRSVILIGAGCSRKLASALCDLGVPVLVTWQAVDFVPEDCPVFCGRPGTTGQRAANVIQQKADALYVFGARLDQYQTNYHYETFAPKAEKYVYDIDLVELGKYPVDWHKTQVDLHQDFAPPPIQSDSDWLKWCKALYKRFRPELDGDRNTPYVDPYLFVNHLSDACQEGEIIVPASSGMQSCAMMQAFKVKKGQRILLCNTIGAMGMEPMAIGAAVASGKRVVVVSGDGGFFLNMQELEVVKRLGLEIKYFVFDNGGYGSVAAMQDSWFQLHVASDKRSGVTFPDLKKVAQLFEFGYGEIRDNDGMGKIGTILGLGGTIIVRVYSSLNFRYAIKVGATLREGKFVNDDMSDMTPKVDDLERIMQE
jgi:acetolactate synthase-1/2/3 large subunit